MTTPTTSIIIFGEEICTEWRRQFLNCTMFGVYMTLFLLTK